MAREGGYVGQIDEGATEDQFCLEGVQVDDQEVISIKLVPFEEHEDVAEEMGERDKGN
jgi:hypothetical protein